MFHDHAGGHRELLREGPGGRQVGEVVERQGVALQLVDAREDVAAGSGLRVQGGALMRVLAVREVEHLFERRRNRARALLAAGEPRSDGGLVGGRRREGLGGEAAPGVERELAVLTQLVEHGAVLIRTADRRHARVVLRSRPQHRGAADVDHLDGVVLAHAPAPGDLCERIEVHAHELERPDAELVERERVLLAVGPREDRRVHVGVQRLHAPAEELAGPRQLLDERHAELVLLDEGRRASARDELDAELREAARERVEAGLVVDGEERALDHFDSSLSTCG